MKAAFRPVAFVFLFLFLATSCKKDDFFETEQITQGSEFKSLYAGFPESFESGSKTGYAAGNVNFTTGSWSLVDALVGTTSSDRRAGSRSIRIQNAGSLSMNFNVTAGASVVSVKHARFGSDASSTWELNYSTNNGTSWIKAGNTITTSSTTLTTATFALNISGNVRFRVRKLSGGKLNIDDFSITNNTTVATRDNNMALGNPSSATTSVLFPDNYLVEKSQFALSYNNARGTANWVSWHLSNSWIGTAPRCDCFTADNTLPSSFYRVVTGDYTGTGFDRGHICPSADRDANTQDNAVTFLMTNIMPQAPNLNRVTWAALEDYCRTLASQNLELYIISGGYGRGGNGSNGGLTNTIANGRVTVPSNFWKIIVILPIGDDDVNRISTSTRVIAVNMPNTQTVNSQSWGFYRTTVDQIEQITGYNFLSNVPATIQAQIESAIDNGPTL